MKKTLFKMFMALVLMLSFGGCATGGSTGSISSASAGNVKDFNSAIHAYNLKKDMAYLKSASKYAVTDSEKAILERKLVDYLGADKVFDVQITNSLGTLKGYSYAGMFSGGKGSKQNIKLFVKVTPRENLPFILKYNTYKLFLGIKEDALYGVKSDFSKKYDTAVIKNITVGMINLKPSNRYSYSKTINEKITVYHKAAGFMNNGGKASLKKLDYTPIIDLYTSSATLQENGLKWQNYYPFTNGHYVKFINTKYAFSENKAKKYCKNLTIDNGGWRLPTKENLKVLASSGISNSLVGTQSKIGKELYYSDTFDDWYGRKWRISDFDEKKLKRGEKYTAIRCVKSTQNSFYDKKRGLEWENLIRYKTGNPNIANKVCQEKGRGWRLPTPKEYSHMIKNNTIHFSDHLKSSNSTWKTSKWKNTGKWWMNLFTTVKPTGEILDNVIHQGSAFRCVRRR